MTLYAGILIGGASRRMATPKHLLRRGESTFAELLADQLKAFTPNVFFLGPGELPSSLAWVGRLDDWPRSQGPLCGIAGALRHVAFPWLILGCDLPLVGPRALTWLLGERDPDAVATLPVDEAGIPQPHFAVYEPKALGPVEALIREGQWAPSRLAAVDGVKKPILPAAVSAELVNVNEERDLRRIGARR